MANYDLNQLANYFGISLIDNNLVSDIPFENKNIAQLRIDSRLVKHNDLFIALKGQQHDGRDFIPQAIAAGACAILVESNDPALDKSISYLMLNNQPTLQIIIYKLSEKISTFANTFYGNPSAKMNVVGVTGTNGKTTVTQLIAQWATLLGKKSAVLGTIGNGIYGYVSPSENTTSANVDIQAYLAKFNEENVKLTAMEVSSHGLVLGRVSDITFSVSVFTNLSRDHLDFHHNMDNYANAKWSLFSPLATEKSVMETGKSIIYFDDEVGKSWINKLDNVIAVSISPNNLNALKKLGKSYIGVTTLRYHEQGVSIFFDSSFGSGVLESRLIGSFNVANLLLAFATLLGLDFSLDSLVDKASTLLPICGRMETFTAKNKPTVIVDYAHTPDALDKALNAVSEHCQGFVWVIFGCGGDRDSGKRPLMAKIAQLHSQHIIITNDNPRTENEDLIINDIVQGIGNDGIVKIIKDRRSAIQWAIDHADINDVILVAGKGHEDYQIINTTKHAYSDRETVRELLGNSR